MEVQEVKVQIVRMKTEMSKLMQRPVATASAIKSPTYDDITSGTMYRRQFESAADGNAWDSQEKAIALVISSGAALELLQKSRWTNKGITAL